MEAAKTEAAYIFAWGGTIQEVHAGTLLGNVQSKVAFVGGQPQGGNIGLVTAEHLESASIHADYYLNSVVAGGEPRLNKVLTVIEGRLGRS